MSLVAGYERGEGCERLLESQLSRLKSDWEYTRALGRAKRTVLAQCLLGLGIPLFLGFWMELWFPSLMSVFWNTTWARLLVVGTFFIEILGMRWVWGSLSFE